MEILEQQAKKLYPDSPEWFKKQLEEEFGHDFFKPKEFESVKTFQDACKKEGIDPKYLPEFPAMEKEFVKPLTAAYKLMVIFKAINNGWRPDWSNWSQYKYFPWFRVLSSGFGFGGSNYGYGHSYTTVRSQLC